MKKYWKLGKDTTKREEEDVCPTHKYDSPTERIITLRITSERITSERINTERITS
jgi:hypothetical protein